MESVHGADRPSNSSKTSYDHHRHSLRTCFWADAAYLYRSQEEGSVKSNCCNADVLVSSADEGTNCWICCKCGKSCDAVKEMKTKESVLASILDCSDHSMDGTRILSILAEFEKEVWNSAIDAVEAKLDAIEELSKLKP